MMNLNRDDLESLQEGLALLLTAPPEVATIVPRRVRLGLQRALLGALPGWRFPAPFTIYWRHYFRWSEDAVVGCGEVHWGAGARASFAVDVSKCTLRAPNVPSVIMLSLHLQERTRDVTPGTAA